MLFTDGMSNENRAFDAAMRAARQGITVQTLLLGSSNRGTEILETIAWATGGSFVRVENPEMLPDAFLNLRTTGVDSVTLSVNGSDPVPARLAGGTFAANLPIEIGENRIVAVYNTASNDLGDPAHYDELMQITHGTADQQVRMGAFAEMQQRLYQDIPIIPTHESAWIYLQDDRVSGFMKPG